MFNRSRSNESQKAKESLNQAIAAFRQSIPEPRGLSAGARETILREALDQTRHPAGFPALFFPVRRLFAAGMAPVVLIAVGIMMNLGPVGDPEWSSIKGIQAKKLGDQVVFTLDNGKGPHRVIRSTTPDGFDSSRAIRVEDSRFVDRASSGPELVFYWIE